MKLKLVLVVTLLFVKVGNAQIYTPNGTIQGVSSNNNVGIGTSTPNSQLSLTKASSVLGDPQSISLYEDSLANYGFAVNGAQGGMDFCANQTVGTSFRWFGGSNKTTPKQLMVLLGNGNIGIGTINPSNKLSIVDNSETQFMASFVGGKVYENYRYAAISYGEATLLGSSANIGYMSHTSDKSLSGLYFTNYGESEKLSSLFIKSGGNVGIGTINPDSKLAVNGTIHSKEVKVDMTGWSDFVFKKEYDLPTLTEVEKHIQEKGHLENIPSEEEVLKNGINLGEMNAKLLQKIEELTLYMIEMKKENEEIKKKNQRQDEKIMLLENKLSSK